MKRIVVAMIAFVLAQSSSWAGTRTSYATYVRSGVGAICLTGFSMGPSTLEVGGYTLSPPAGVFIGDARACSNLATRSVAIEVNDVVAPVVGGTYEFRAEGGELLAASQFCGATPIISAPTDAVVIVVTLDDSCGQFVAGTVRFNWA